MAKSVKVSEKVEYTIYDGVLDTVKVVEKKFKGVARSHVYVSSRDGNLNQIIDEMTADADSYSPTAEKYGLDLEAGPYA